MAAPDDDANHRARLPAAAGAQHTNAAAQPSHRSSEQAKPPCPLQPRRAAAVTNGRKSPPQFVERPYKWSQRWRDDPPVGTIV